ncbi:unnamed protein product [Oppiella nova]|uniref:Lipocalin/cytosolic fatty-acid binding domain-containing protein n=1 Tax=Oppiella nova TaxID=334625 RepID=A0A7R9QT18_9ACAR|nr:unnamed protein product [Oppiella nova]CAG2173896.1 unnamed protein product [Oppiella nova]
MCMTARVTTTTTTPVPVMSSTTSLIACPNVNGMANINTNKIMGLWYELAMAPNNNLTYNCPQMTLTPVKNTNTFDFSFTAQTMNNQPIQLGLTGLPMNPSSMILNMTLELPDDFLETFTLFGRKPNIKSISTGAMNTIQQTITVT